MLTNTGTSDLVSLVPDVVEGLTDEQLNQYNNLYWADRNAVCCYAAGLLHCGHDDAARAAAAEAERVFKSLVVLAEESSIRRTAVASLATVHAELAKDGA